MASSSVDVLNARRSVQWSFMRFADRWIWVFMAALFVSLALAGFIPDSIRMVGDIRAHKRPPLPWFLHIHAVAMGSWLLVLLAQTLLMATGRRRGHMSLGVASLALAPLVCVMMGVMMGSVLAQVRPLSVPLTAFSGAVAFVFDVQGRSIVLFTVCYIWAFSTRHARPDTHKRMMLLATWSLIDAGIARIPGSQALMLEHFGLKRLGLVSPNDFAHAWLLVVLLPALLYDLLRRGCIHYAWVAGIALFLPFAVASHFLEPAPLWWQHIVTGITGRH